MAGKSTIRSLRVQASQSVDVAFNMPGIVAWQNYDHVSLTGPAYLGQEVHAMNLDTLIYQKLHELDTSDDGLLLFGAKNIRTVMQTESLFALRNEALGASLDQMLQQRRAAWRDRYKYADKFAKLMQQFVPDMITHLAEMRSSGTERFTELDKAYGKGGVVTELTTRTTAPNTTSRTKVSPVTTVSAELDGNNNQPVQGPIQTNIFEIKGGGAEELVQRQKTPRTLTVPAVLQEGAWQPVTGPFDTQVVETTVSGAQNMTSELQTFAHPKLENKFGYHQAMVGLLPELLRHETNKLKLAEIKEIMASELAAMDLEIKGLQLNFIHSYLTSPIDGVITGVFKDIGESVEPGEPVVRIENDKVVFIVGRVQYQGQLWVGRSADLMLASVFEDGRNTTIKGEIVAIRGHESDNDEWEIIVRIKNPIVNGRPLLPLNYHFDPDTDRFLPT